ncbi:MAG TPA: CPBP family intramembrane glutamic endopeptidase [Thermoanaerobaculia bacterium]|nr:CPBP family intramembrane glutamic endopeptidase [Thermoanaerobaculia bacterium]
MRRFVQDLSDRAELAVIVGFALIYYVAASLYVLVSGIREIDMTIARVARATAMELLILAVVAAILRARGWTTERLGLRFSWGAALAGIPLFVIFLLIYWITATCVLLVFPAARTVWAFRIHPEAPIEWMLVLFIVNSLFEELIVTAYVTESLREHGAALVISASTLLRFSYHLYQGPLASLSILPLGLLFATLYWQRRTLWPLMVAHTIFNLVSYALTPR